MEQERAQRRHERILEAALSVFSRKGYREASMDEVAARSGTSKGGVYFHFPGKQALFLALLDRTATQLRTRIEGAVEGLELPMDKAEAALLAVVEVFSEHRALARLFMVEALGAGPEFHQRMAEIRDEFAALLEGHLKDAISSGAIPPVDTEIASRAWFGAVYEVITHWILSGDSRPLSEAYKTLRPLLLRSLEA